MVKFLVIAAAARQLLENTRRHPKRYYLLYSGGLFSTMQFLHGKKWQIVVRLPKRNDMWMVHGSGILYNFCAQHALSFSALRCEKRFYETFLIGSS